LYNGGVKGSPGNRGAIAIVLVFVVIGAAAAETRTVTVNILTDSAFRKDPAWQLKAESCLKAAALELERIADLRFEIVGHAEWLSPLETVAVEKIARDLDNRYPKNRADILLAILGVERLGQTFYGYALFQEAIVVLTYPPSAPPPVRTLRHELGHLFGAVHVPVTDSVMNYFVPQSRFDDLNAKAVAAGRDRSFNRIESVFPHDARLALAAVYEEICEAIRTQIETGMPRLGFKALVDEAGRRDLSFLDDVFVALAQVRLDEKEYSRVLESCEEALKLNPGNWDTQNLVGIALRRMGRVDEAIARYKDILKANPDFPRVLYNLGIALAKNGDLASARAAYERAIALKPNFAEAHNNLGEIRLRLGDLGIAESEIREALKIQPRFPLALSNLAEVMFRKKDFGAAADLAGQASALDATLPDPWNVLGNIRHQEGRTDEAIAAYEKALALDRRHEKVHYNLGLCLFETGRADEAELHFATALNIEPAFAEARASYGSCLLKRKRLDEGIREIEEALRLGYGSASAFLNLSTAFVQKGDFGRALAEARRAVERDPALKDAWTQLGSLLLHEEKAGEALEPFLKAAALDPRDGRVANNLAVCLFRAGDFQKAWEYARKAQALGVVLHPDFVAALKAKVGRKSGRP
jgi:tetratricopeptide (TPR) repeat protein